MGVDGLYYIAPYPASWS